MMLLDVVQFKIVDDYTLRLVFENGEVKNFDSRQLFEKKPYACLKDKNFFNRAKLKHGTIVWNDDIDISPETLYALGY